MNCVLDTNVVIDWLVFDDPFMSPLRTSVRDGRVVVITHQPAVDELRRVLSYRALKLSTARQNEVLREYETRTTHAAGQDGLPDERSHLPKGFPRCRDSDDDHFLELAYRARAHALVSRDEAVLATGRRCRMFGFSVLTVEQLMAAIAQTVATV